MKIALINATGSRELPLLEEFLDRQHHLVYIAPTPLPTTLRRRPVTPARFEHHHISLDDTRQLITALQNCDLALLCQTKLPLVTPTQHNNLTAACNTAQVPQLITLNLSRPRPLRRPAPIHSLAQPFLIN